LEVVSVIDEKHGGFDIVFLPQFAEKDFGEGGGCRGKITGREADRSSWDRRQHTASTAGR
jgi:hypothetical protein